MCAWRDLALNFVFVHTRTEVQKLSSQLTNEALVKRLEEVKADVRPLMICGVCGRDSLEWCTGGKQAGTAASYSRHGPNVGSRGKGRTRCQIQAVPQGVGSTAIEGDGHC